MHLVHVVHSTSSHSERGRLKLHGGHSNIWHRCWRCFVGPLTLQNHRMHFLISQQSPSRLTMPSGFEIEPCTCGSLIWTRQCPPTGPPGFPQTSHFAARQVELKLIYDRIAFAQFANFRNFAKKVCFGLEQFNVAILTLVVISEWYVWLLILRRSELGIYREEDGMVPVIRIRLNQTVFNDIISDFYTKLQMKIMKNCKWTVSTLYCDLVCYRCVCTMAWLPCNKWGLVPLGALRCEHKWTESLCGLRHDFSVFHWTIVSCTLAIFRPQNNLFLSHLLSILISLEWQEIAGLIFLLPEGRQSSMWLEWRCDFARPLALLSPRALCRPKMASLNFAAPHTTLIELASTSLPTAAHANERQA